MRGAWIFIFISILTFGLVAVLTGKADGSLLVSSAANVTLTYHHNHHNHSDKSIHQHGKGGNLILSHHQTAKSHPHAPKPKTHEQPPNSEPAKVVKIPSDCGEGDFPHPILRSIPNFTLDPFLELCSDAKLLRTKIKHAIENKIGFMVGKIGGVEYTQLNGILADKDYRVSQKLLNNAGVFPLKKSVILKWAETFHKALQHLDIVSVWSGHQINDLKLLKPMYQELTNKGTKTITGVAPFWSWYWTTPYTKYFENKTVLVISPYDNIIEQYYTKRTCIFPFNQDIHPPYEIKAIVSKLPPPVDKKPTQKDATWLTVLEDMLGQMDNTTYDVLIVGAGAYSLPLAAHAKLKGKVGIHLGGNIGTFLGIKGGRFDHKIEYTSLFYNDCWSRVPKPPGAKLVEDSAYWRKKRRR